MNKKARPESFPKDVREETIELVRVITNTNDISHSTTTTTLANKSRNKFGRTERRNVGSDDPDKSRCCNMFSQ